MYIIKLLVNINLEVIINSIRVLIVSFKEINFVF